jgi:hypothetical protein
MQHLSPQATFCEIRDRRSFYVAMTKVFKGVIGTSGVTANIRLVVQGGNVFPNGAGVTMPGSTPVV